MGDALDLSLLSATEVAEYERIQSTPSNGSIVGTAVLWAVIWIGATVGLFVWSAHLATLDSTMRIVEWVVTAAAYVSLIMGGVMLWGGTNQRVKEIRKEQGKELSRFKALIRYDDRVYRAARANQEARDDGPDPRYTWMTGTYDPKRYYSYDKSQRDYMKMTGMDADDYDANVEGRER